MSIDLQEDVSVNGETFWVSTVAMPAAVFSFIMDRHGFGYETMVFRRLADGTVDYGDLFCDRYITEEDAEAGHRSCVERLKTGTLFEIVGAP